MLDSVQILSLKTTSDNNFCWYFICQPISLTHIHYVLLSHSEEKFGPLCLTSSIIHSPWLLLTLVHELGALEDFSIIWEIVGISCLFSRWCFPTIIALFLKDMWSTVFCGDKDYVCSRKLCFLTQDIPPPLPPNSYWLSITIVMKQSQRVNSRLWGVHLS